MLAVDDVVRELINVSTHVEDKHYLWRLPGRKLLPGKICNIFVSLAVANHERLNLAVYCHFSPTKINRSADLYRSLRAMVMSCFTPIGAEFFIGFLERKDHVS